LLTTNPNPPPTIADLGVDFYSLDQPTATIAVNFRDPHAAEFFADVGEDSDGAAGDVSYSGASGRRAGT
jgi:hypothetical protein